MWAHFHNTLLSLGAPHVTPMDKQWSIMSERFYDKTMDYTIPLYRLKYGHQPRRHKNVAWFFVSAFVQYWFPSLMKKHCEILSPIFLPHSCSSHFLSTHTSSSHDTSRLVDYFVLDLGEALLAYFSSKYAGLALSSDM